MKYTQSTSNDPFLLRAIEHWLDSVNELTYQPIFCFWLTSKGYQVKYSIKSTIFEQGKDVVAVNKKGYAEAYQLKGGDINTSRWRREVLPEIVALIDLPIKHPEINDRQKHISYIVTNGIIEDAVRIEINDYNKSTWKKHPLHILDRGDLLTAFQSIANGILPKDAKSYKQLMDFLFLDGTGLPDLDNVSKFLYEIMELNNPKFNKKIINKEKVKRDIAVGTFYANMIAGTYRKEKNHIAVIQIMTLLNSTILYLAEKYELHDKYWIQSYEIVWNDLLNTAQQLDKEVNELDFEIKATSPSPFDGHLIDVKKYLITSIIYPLKLSEYISGNSDWTTVLNEEVAKNYVGPNFFLAESFFIPTICLVKIFNSISELEEFSKELIENAIITLFRLSGRNSKYLGMPTPYYSVSQLVGRLFNLEATEDMKKFTTSSYYLQILMDILVRLDDKLFLQQNWKEISFMKLEEFVPDSKVDFLLWKVEKGINKTTLLPSVKKWDDLKNETFSFSGESLPDLLKRFPMFIPFFISVFPHRVNRDIIGFIFNIKTPENFKQQFLRYTSTICKLQNHNFQDKQDENYHFNL